MVLDPDEVIKKTWCPIAVIDYFGILDNTEPLRYPELGCKVKGLGRGHIRRMKESIKHKQIG